MKCFKLHFYLKSITPARSTVVTNRNLASILIISFSRQTVTLLCAWWREEPKHIQSCFAHSVARNVT